MTPPESTPAASNSPPSNVVPFAPRHFVIDASVAIKWYVAEDRYRAARALEHFGNPLAAPDFLAVELANIAWKKARLKQIESQHAALIAAPEALSRVALLPNGPLTAAAFVCATELDHPVYDCLYLACAVHLGGVLITADDRFVRIVADSAYARFVRPLGDLQPV